MRVDVSYGFTGDGDEDWSLASLYLTDAEIAERGLEPTSYNGEEYDWITLPERDYGAEAGEHLVAAYGGMLSEICMVKSYADMTTASAAYYGRQGWQESRINGDTDYLPRDLMDKLWSAIEDKYGTYSKDDFANPYFNGEAWIENSEGATE